MGFVSRPKAFKTIPMSAFKNPDFNDRLAAASKAKTAAMEKFRLRPGPDDPAVLERQAAQAAISRDREARRAERKAAREAEARRLEAERLAELRVQEGEVERQAAAAAEKAARAAAIAAEQKAARDARYAARRARRR